MAYMVSQMVYLLFSSSMLTKVLHVLTDCVLAVEQQYAKSWLAQFHRLYICYAGYCRDGNDKGSRGPGAGHVRS